MSSYECLVCSDDLGIKLHSETPLCQAAPELLAALGQIAESPVGVYSRDKEEYLKNVIAWCQETARAAIAKAVGKRQHGLGGRIFA